MHYIKTFDDSRLSGFCVHCGKGVKRNETNKDHVPPRAILNKPYPDRLPVTFTCKKCNNDFARQEEYFSAFLGILGSGTTNIKNLVWNRAAVILKSNKSLHKQLQNEFTFVSDEDGKQWSSFKPKDPSIIETVLKKIARGHIQFELSKTLTTPPTQVSWFVATQLSECERDIFETVTTPTFFPEVGTRGFIRTIEGQDMLNGGVHVQHLIYRYLVSFEDKYRVRMVFHEILLAEVSWDIE